MKRRTQTVSSSLLHTPRSGLFLALVSISFILLVWYRALSHFPVWFDEGIVKAVLFGLPLLMYAIFTKQSITKFGLEPKRFWLGAYLGLALGGTCGFIAMFMSALKNQGHMLIPYLFFSPQFWWVFFLAFLTAWWESLFFYGFVLSVLERMYKGNEWKATGLSTIIFVLFHAPILLLRDGVSASVLPLVLLGLFAFGQSVIFLRYKSLISMVVSHAFWGMTLLVYTLK